MVCMYLYKCQKLNKSSLAQTQITNLFERIQATATETHSVHRFFSIWMDSQISMRTELKKISSNNVDNSIVDTENIHLFRGAIFARVEIHTPTHTRRNVSHLVLRKMLKPNWVYVSNGFWTNSDSTCTHDASRFIPRPDRLNRTAVIWFQHFT